MRSIQCILIVLSRLTAPSVLTENDIDHWMKRQIVMAYTGSCSFRFMSVSIGIIIRLMLCSLILAWLSCCSVEVADIFYLSDTFFCFFSRLLLLTCKWRAPLGDHNMWQVHAVQASQRTKRSYPCCNNVIPHWLPTCKHSQLCSLIWMIKPELYLPGTEPQLCAELDRYFFFYVFTNVCMLCVHLHFAYISVPWCF